MAKAPSILAEIIRVAGSLHKAGTFSNVALNAIVRHASQHDISYSAETGCGASTLLFSHLSSHHTVFALDGGTDSIRAVQASPLLRADAVTFVEGPTQLTLASHRFENKLQLALIDGPHAYPFPDLEYFYLYEHLDEHALLIVDDIHIRSVAHLFEFLSADDMFELVEVVETTAFFRRTSAAAFSRVGDGWWMQGYNRRDFEVMSAIPGETDRLARSAIKTPYYIDEFGTTKSPSRRLSVTVAASRPLVVAGWAIDAAHQRPAAWVELVCDGRAFRAEVRSPRLDVANRHRHVGYLRCGFRATLPADCVPIGRHRFSLRIVLHGGTTYYEAPELTFVAK